MCLTCFSEFVNLNIYCVSYSLPKMMKLNCSICSDLFDETNPISAAPCGHVYHTSCLRVWVARSRTCPQCRSHTTVRGIQKLYFNFLSPSDINSSQSSGNELANLTALLSAKEVELETCKKEKQEAHARVCEKEKRISDMDGTILRLMYENSELHMKVQRTSVLEAEVLKLEQVNATLTDDLERLSNVQKVVNGTLRDAEDTVKEYKEHSTAARELATYCACLKRLLYETIELNDNLKDLNSKLKCENSVYTSEIKFYEDALQIPKRSLKRERVRVTS